MDTTAAFVRPAGGLLTLEALHIGDLRPREVARARRRLRMIDLYQAGHFPFERINDALDAVHRSEATKAVLTFDSYSRPTESDEQ
jgi:hypothetical protein